MLTSRFDNFSGRFSRGHLCESQPAAAKGKPILTICSICLLYRGFVAVEISCADKIASVRDGLVIGISF